MPPERLARNEAEARRFGTTGRAGAGKAGKIGIRSGIVRHVIPAEAGIHFWSDNMDSRFRGNDDVGYGRRSGRIDSRFQT
jgi:hypothetical protein